MTEKEDRILESETLAKGIIAAFLGVLGFLLWVGVFLAQGAKGMITDLLCGAALLAVAGWMGMGHRRGKKAMAEKHEGPDR